MGAKWGKVQKTWRHFDIGNGITLWMPPLTKKQQSQRQREITLKHTNYDHNRTRSYDYAHEMVKKQWQNPETRKKHLEAVRRNREKTSYIATLKAKKRMETRMRNYGLGPQLALLNERNALVKKVKDIRDQYGLDINLSGMKSKDLEELYEHLTRF